MANRVEINENVESAIGLNLTGATVTVRFRGGAQAPVYDRQNGGAIVVQPLVTVNGKIGGDSPSGAWVTEGSYDLDVTFGSDTLTYAWNAAQIPQFVTTLPAGVGTSAPEDGEHAIELYDAANGGAWLRRYRAALAAWDMVGGPPPAGNVLPVGPRVRQEFYLTGGSPTVQHLRYNGASWDYVGTPPTVPITGSPLTILDVGQAGQIRAGRQLAVADFTTLAALPTTPVGLFNLGSTANLGSGGALVNKGSVVFTTGIEGVANAAARFDGSTGQALYINDTGAADPFRIATGSWGAWFRTNRRSIQQQVMGKGTTAQFSWLMDFNSTNTVRAWMSPDGTGGGGTQAQGTSDVADGKWHHAVGTSDGNRMKVYVDGVLEGEVAVAGPIFPSSGPLNIGGRGADNVTVAANPFFGMIDEAFVTADVLSEDQVRLLYAAKAAHGYSSPPRLNALNIRRRRRGAALATSDFPAQPLRLHNFVGGSLSDLGSNATALTTNVGTGVQSVVAGPDGNGSGGAYNMSGAHGGLQATDTGLPSALAARSYGLWVKIGPAAGPFGLMGWGSIGTADARLIVSNGTISPQSAADTMTGQFIGDNMWHHVVVVEDNAALDGLKRRLYVDTRLVSTSTVMNSITLAGANKFRIGANEDGTAANTAPSSYGPAFVYAGALTAEQIAVLYQKSSQTLPPSAAEPGQFVEAMDATNVYMILDRLESNYQVDLAVAA